MNQLPQNIFTLPPRKIACQDGAKIIESKLDDSQCGFCSITEEISTLQQILMKSWEHAKDLHILSIWGKYIYGWVARKKRLQCSRLTHVSVAEVGSENCKFGICALSHNAHRLASSSYYAAAGMYSMV